MGVLDMFYLLQPLFPTFGVALMPLLTTELL